MPNKIQGIDEAILFYIQTHLKSPALDRIMVSITSLGNAGLIWIVIAFLFLITRKYKKCGISIICTLFLSRIMGDDILKPWIGRIRPCHKFTQIPLVIPPPHSFSFPSGHTMIGFACATIIFHFNKKLGSWAYIIASLIAYSRLHLFLHYPTDILGGIAFGILTSQILLLILEFLSRKLNQDKFH